MRRGTCCLWTTCLLLLGQPPARAGMPAPLPTDPERVLRLNDTALLRLRTISFFVAALLLCAVVVHWLWNYLGRDFPKLPRLSFAKALAGVLLWGLLFLIVLTMISGARELMTPGAWQKQGFTYKLTSAAPPAPEAAPLAVRKQHLDELRTALWRFAATHRGQFPAAEQQSAIAADLWSVPEAGGTRYLYVPGLSARQSTALLAYEPELDPQQRLALQVNGDIVSMSSQQIRAALKPEKRP